MKRRFPDVFVLYNECIRKQSNFIEAFMMHLCIPSFEEWIEQQAIPSPQTQIGYMARENRSIPVQTTIASSTKAHLTKAPSTKAP